MTRIVFWYILAVATGAALSLIIDHMISLAPIDMPTPFRAAISILIGFGIAWNLLAPEEAR